MMQKIELPFDAELLPMQKLVAGDITCFYEQGSLRYIRYGNSEIIRLVYTAVRNEAWATASIEITNEVITLQDDSFSIQYTAVYHFSNAVYKAAIQIEGKRNNITFTMQGEALSDFLRNRIGICVLHPIKECAGRKVIIQHPDGTKQEAVFPKDISPHQPFIEVQQMQWDSPVGTAVLRFEGDVFETEDQRNWTDNSYKTYSTRLSIPFPVQVKSGDKMEQSISLDFEPKKVEGKDETLNVSTTSIRIPFPKIGYERMLNSKPLLADDIIALKKIIFDIYRVVLHLSRDGWRRELEVAVAEATTLGVQIEAVIFVAATDDKKFNELVQILEPFSKQLVRILFLHEGEQVTPAKWLKQAFPILKSKLPGVQIGYGTDGSFVELNRNRPAGDLPFDFISYSLYPQAHATDTRTIWENLQAQGDTIKLAKTFAAGKEIIVSPVTFKIRQSGESDTARTDEDARMYSAFGAMWTLLSIKNLAGADSISFYQAKGYRGIIHDELQSDSPLYRVLEQLKDFQPKWVITNNVREDELLVENDRGEQMSFCFEGESNDLMHG